jgi:hypothetical protein
MKTEIKDENYSFSYLGYERLLNVGIKNKYNFIPYQSVDEFGGKFCLLRHDVDADILSALQMAKMENKLGIRSTFFFMTRSVVYNLFSKVNSEMVKEIINLNHEVGLHFDASYWSNNNLLLNQVVINDVNYFESNFDIKVKVISFHQPSSEIISGDIILENYINTYDTKYFKDILYISDSNKKWKNQHPIDIFNDPNVLNVQLLIHPMWWMTNEYEETTSDRWNKILLQNVSRTQDYLYCTERAYPNPSKFYFG